MLGEMREQCTEQMNKECGVISKALMLPPKHSCHMYDITRV